MSAVPEAFARRILEQTIAEERCSEFLECMWDGGSPTLDAVTGRLVLASGAAIASLFHGLDDDRDDDA